MEGSGISTQKLWSTQGPPPGARREEPAMKNSPRSYVGQPLVADSNTDNPLESEESDTIASPVRTYRPDPQQDAVRRQIERENEQREREGSKKGGGQEAPPRPETAVQEASSKG